MSLDSVLSVAGSGLAAVQRALAQIATHDFVARPTHVLRVYD